MIERLEISLGQCLELWLLELIVTVSITFDLWFLGLILSKMQEVSYFISLLLEDFATFIVFDLDKRLFMLSSWGMCIVCCISFRLKNRKAIPSRFSNLT